MMRGREGRRDPHLREWAHPHCTNFARGERGIKHGKFKRDVSLKTGEMHAKRCERGGRMIDVVYGRGTVGPGLQPTRGEGPSLIPLSGEEGAAKRGKTNSPKGGACRGNRWRESS